MNRRTIFASLAGLGAGLVTMASAKADPAPAPRVVYHLSDAAMASFVLGNMRNHLKGTAPDPAKLAVVVHGPALKMFKADATDDTKAAVQSLLQDACVFYACINTMQAMHLTIADLLPGFAVAEKGGVVKLADLQAQGWIYLRP